MHICNSGFEVTNWVLSLKYYTPLYTSEYWILKISAALYEIIDMCFDTLLSSITKYSYYDIDPHCDIDQQVLKF